MIGVLD